MRKVQIKEPIKKKWIWIVLVLILLGGVPWYLPTGSIEPFILGFPFWAFISAVFAIILSFYLSWLCLNEWHIVEDIEEKEKELKE
ncbi:hypothetical protein MHB50_09025 [Siminovitchia sp. FSL H7-0308]|uniref:DUF3311 domain-containing protein n=1 Tax=Siminovitchia thermophila TaxID=1245522 RepID=A0ABS2RC01_9BACI|nr:hypothetical protein [Siminovitchia thermophila]MBM7716865.1 hypothetical protein [Siminovitchia thermophila]ONK22064.1 hypothetical protein BLX87_19435 [Bacillus sp. VT-16-64]